MKVEVVTAPAHKYFPNKSLKLFLAGGIQKCIKWQDEIVKHLLNYDGSYNSLYNTLFILNPRRSDWLNEPGEDVRQIEWEFDMIERSDIFTMYFAGGESDQPICMYELGRNIERMKWKYPTTWKDRIVITCDSSYRRLKDVLVQVRLASDDELNVCVVDGAEESVKKHGENICLALNYVSQIYE